MGTSSSNPLKESLCNYNVISQNNQEHITYLSHKKTEKEYLLRQLAFNNQRQFLRSKELHQYRKKLGTSQHLTLLKQNQQSLDDSLCSKFYKIYALWQYPSRNLEEQINERSVQQRKFQEKQLWSILASCILGLSTMQRHDIKHESLTTKNLLLGDQGILKVADPLASSLISNFESLYTNRSQTNLYLSPEQTELLNTRGDGSNLSSYKNDVWSVGIIMLQCGLLSSQWQCYNNDGSKINFDCLFHNLNRFGRQYNQELRRVVQFMLTRQHLNRPDWLDLQKHVKKVEQQESMDTNNKNLLLKNNIQSRQQQHYLHNRPQVLVTNRSQNNIPKIIQQKFPIQRQELNYIQHTFAHQPSSFNRNYYVQTQHLYQPGKLLNKSGSTDKKYMHNQPSYINIQHKQQPIKQVLSQSKIYTNIHSVNSNLQNIKTQRNSDRFERINKTPLINYQKTHNYTPYNNIFSPLKSIGCKLQYNSIQNEKEHLQSNKKSQNSAQKLQPYATNRNQQFSQYTVNKQIKSRTLYEKSESNIVFKNAETSKSISQNVLANQRRFSPNNYQNVITSTNNSSLFTDPNFINELKKPIQLVQSKQVQIPRYISSQFDHSKMDDQNYFGKNVNAQSYSIPSYRNSKQFDNPISKNLQNMGFATKIQTQVKNQGYQNIISKYQHNVQKLNFDNQQSQLFRKVQSNKILAPQQSINSEQIQYTIQHFKHGSKYQGTKLGNMRHGKGKFYYQDGGLYDGEWQYNKMHGYGKLYYQSGNIAYEGQWFEDQFHGHGILYNQNPEGLEENFDYTNFDFIDEYWNYYEGNFTCDLKQGKGKIVFSNGQYLVGNFEKDMVEGEGQFNTKNNQLLNGYWQSNQLIRRL